MLYWGSSKCGGYALLEGVRFIGAAPYQWHTVVLLSWGLVMLPVYGVHFITYGGYDLLSMVSRVHRYFNLLIFQLNRRNSVSHWSIH